MLFDVESRLKRCEPDTKGKFSPFFVIFSIPLEYRELVEEGRRLREHWAEANQQMRDTKPPQDQNHPDYDLSKCVVLGRTKRGVARQNEEFPIDIEE